MKTLEEIFLKLKRDTNSITSNPLLDAFNLNKLKKIDELENTDSFIRKKRKSIIHLSKGIGIDFNPKLIRAYEIYNEASIYLILKNRLNNIEGVPEGANKRPDFKVEYQAKFNTREQKQTFYIEFKTMSYTDGNRNYKEAIEISGVNSQIDIEDQIRKGKRIAIGIIKTQPLLKSSNDYYDPFSIKYTIETFIDKIEQNLKLGQFTLGETILMIDTKLIPLPCGFLEGAVPTYIGGRVRTLVSGVQWNIAFGKKGYPIYRPIEFEGKENIEGELSKNGILIDRDWIKAICFVSYINFDEPIILGLYHSDHANDMLISFLNDFCDFVNDERNTYGWATINQD